MAELIKNRFSPEDYSKDNFKYPYRILEYNKPIRCLLRSKSTGEQHNCLVTIDKTCSAYKEYVSCFTNIELMNTIPSVVSAKRTNTNCIFNDTNTQIKFPNNSIIGTCTIEDDDSVVYPCCFVWSAIEKTPFSVGNTKNAQGSALAHIAELITAWYCVNATNKATSIDTIKKDFPQNIQNEFSSFDFQSWRETFINTKRHIRNIIPQNINSYTIIHDSTSLALGVNKKVRPSSFGNLIHTLCTKMGINKDSWNPADIWIVKTSSYQNMIKQLKEYSTQSKDGLKERLNSFIWFEYKKGNLIPISLKKLKGKGRYEKTNDRDANNEANPKGLIIKDIRCNIALDAITQEVGTISFGAEYLKKRITMQIRFYRKQKSGLGKVQLEITSDGNPSGGRVGKLPEQILREFYKKEILDKILDINRYFGDNENKKYFKNFYSNVLGTKQNTTNSEEYKLFKLYLYSRGVKKIISHKTKTEIKIDIKVKSSNPKNITEFRNLIRMANDDKTNKNGTIVNNLSSQIQGIAFLYIFLKNPDNIQDYLTSLIKGGKKEGKDNSFFIKIY